MTIGHNWVEVTLLYFSDYKSQRDVGYAWGEKRDPQIFLHFRKQFFTFLEEKKQTMRKSMELPHP